VIAPQEEADILGRIVKTKFFEASFARTSREDDVR
jgi:hypothetical protein